MFDTHVNLHSEKFQDDLPDILTRARAAGVSRMIAICDRLDNFPSVQGIAAANDDIWCSVGVHPHHAKDFPELNPEDLIAAAQSDKVVAIGETGLDFHYNYSPEAAQTAALKTHIEAARVTGLPLILHTREADDLVGDIIEQEYKIGAFTPLLHCYTGGARLAARALDLGGYVSVSGILSFNSAKDVRAVIADLPLDRIILETDCPFLAPVPMRGRRNEPAYLIHVAEALASLHDLPVAQIAKITEENALRLFSKVSNEG